MAHTQDFVPSRDAEFDGWLAHLTSYVDGKTTGASPAWTHIPAAKVTDLKQRNTDWHTAYAKTLGPHTSVDTEAKDDARKAAEAFARQFVQQYLKFDPVTNEDRTTMNLHNRDTTHSAIEKPTTRALITDLKGLGGFRTEIRFQDEATPGSHAIPYGMNGCVLNYTAGAEKVSDYALLKETVLMTHSPFTLLLEPEAEGKFLSCATRWQSERGELGPWGEIQHIVVG
ncbi:MAG: hypothetical protein Ta2A_17970 [Treponemataceae bacterium]|nr:MAG: hypothetical protein Ta2A_17970 [Treponemataceae bacterium]